MTTTQALELATEYFDGTIPDDVLVDHKPDTGYLQFHNIGTGCMVTIENGVLRMTREIGEEILPLADFEHALENLQ